MSDSRQRIDPSEVPPKRFPPRLAIGLSALALLGLTGCGPSNEPSDTFPISTSPAIQSPQVSSTAASSTAPTPTIQKTTPDPRPTPTIAGTWFLPPSKVPKSAVLRGKIIGVDPGHNGANGAHPEIINKLVWDGRERKACNTTGTATNAGYTESRFNFKVAQLLIADLRRQGATVVTTRSTDRGVGPCIDQRAKIINAAKADVSISIHADGGPSQGRGFAILQPVADGPNNAVINDSVRFGSALKNSLIKSTPLPPSTYDGVGGFNFRSDLGALNLTTVPAVLLEVGNMRNKTDADLLSSSAFQEHVALAIDQAIVSFLTKSK